MRNTRMRHGRTNGVMHVRTLGRAELSASGTRLGPESPVAFPLLLHLVLERDRWVARTQLQEMLFPEQDRLHARHSLRQSVYLLRKDGFPIEGSGPALHVPAGFVVDDYSSLLTPQLHSERDLSELMGGWLAGFEPTISPAYSHWFEGKRSEIALRMRTALLAELAVHKRNARWAQCERTCRAILSLDPLNEEATLGLAEALALTGAKVQAIRILERYHEELPHVDLQVAAGILRRRITDRLPDTLGPNRRAPLFGRDAEMACAATVLDRALGATASGLVLSGEPGIGKSRVLQEVESVAALRGFRTLSHCCRLHDVHRPLGVFTSLLPRLRTMKGAIGCAPTALPLLKRLEELPQAEPAARLMSVDWAEFAHSVTWAISDLVSAVASESPLLVIVDDIHWADDASTSVLSSLLAAMDQRLAIAVGVRASGNIAVLPGQSVEAIVLRPLPPAAGRELFLSAFGSPDEAVEALEWAESIAAGNPLFLTTLARHVRAHPGSRALPGELEHLLEARLSDLPQVDNQVFCAICALGRNASYTTLHRSLELPRHHLLEALTRLERQGFVTSTPRGVEPSHSLLAERGLQRLPEAARRYIYHIAATALAEEAPPDDIIVMWDVVHLTRKSGADNRATSLARQLARHALSIGRPAEACELLAESRATATAESDRIGLAADLLVSSRAAGRWTLAKEIAQEFIERPNDHEFERPELLFMLAEADWHLTHAYMIIAPRLSQALDDPSLSTVSRAKAAELLLISAVNLNDAALGQRALDAAMQNERGSSELSTLASKMIFEISFGDLASAAAIAQELISLVTASPLTIHSIRHLCNGASALSYIGRTDDALIVLTDGYDRSQLNKLSAGAWRCANDCASLLMLAGRLGDADIWLEKAEEARVTSPSAVDGALIDELRCWHLILTGHPRAALPLAASLVADSSQRSGRSLGCSTAALALAEQMVGETQIAGDQVDEVVSLYYAHRGMLESEIWTWAVCRLLDATGRRVQAMAIAADYVKQGRREQRPVASALLEYLGR